MFQKWLDLLFPASCVLCGGRGEIHGSLCRTCYSRYIRERMECCPLCGQTALFCQCGASFVREAVWPQGRPDGTRLNGVPFLALSFYHKQKNKNKEERCTEELLFQLKERGACVPLFAAELAAELQKLFSKAGETPQDWCLTYAPRSPENIQRFGLDQGEEIARTLARKMHLSFRPVIHRISGEEQKKLTAAGRRANARTSLAVEPRADFTGLKFLLFDDIITSGATVTAAARLLYEHGAAEVFPLCIARTYSSRM